MDEVEFLKKSIEIPSISGYEAAFSDYLVDQMKKVGFESWKDEVGNAIGQIGEGKPVLLLCSHLDTVPGMIPVKIENGQIFGRGAVDAKGSLISMICAAARYIGKPIPGKIIVAGIVEEETSIKGIFNLLNSLKEIDYAIFGEPSGLNRICIASKGRIHLHLLVKSLLGNSHVSSYESENPIHIAFDFWSDLSRRMSQKPFLGKTPYFSVELNITIIKGGLATNTIPDACELDIDIRFPSAIKASMILKEIESSMRDYEQKNTYQIKYKILSHIEGIRAKKDTDLVIALKNAIEEVAGIESKFLRKAGTNFMAIIAQELNIPVVSYGPGDSRLDHSQNEHISIKEYQKAIEVLSKFISNLLPI